MREYHLEPVPGLPERLPDGERVLWRGAPDWRILARKALHTRLVAIYFAALALWSVGIAATDGATSLARVGAALVPPLVSGAALLGVLYLFAWISAKTSVYTLTNKRVVLRVGAAIPKAINIPFAIIEGADLKAYADGGGSIALTLEGEQINYFNLWPHARPGRFTPAQPTLRALADPAPVAKLLHEAWSAARARAEPAPAAVERVRETEPA